MGSIISSRPNEELEEEGDEVLELAVLTYTGSRSVYGNPEMRNQGYPGMGVMNRGVPYVVLLPDSRLGFFETHADIDVEYGDQDIAAALVTGNYLDDQVFGSGYDQRLRDRVFEKLDLEPAYDEVGYREQLIEIAGVDETQATREMDPDEARREELQEETRGDLMKVVGEFEHGFENLSGATKLDLAEFLVDEDDEAVDQLIEDANRGEL